MAGGWTGWRGARRCSAAGPRCQISGWTRSRGKPGGGARREAPRGARAGGDAAPPLELESGAHEVDGVKPTGGRSGRPLVFESTPRRPSTGNGKRVGTGRGGGAPLPPPPSHRREPKSNPSGVRETFGRMGPAIRRFLRDALDGPHMRVVREGLQRDASVTIWRFNALTVSEGYTNSSFS